MKRMKALLAVLAFALLAGCGQPAAEMVSIPATPAPTPEVSQTQVLRAPTARAITPKPHAMI